MWKNKSNGPKLKKNKYQIWNYIFIILLFFLSILGAICADCIGIFFCISSIFWISYECFYNYVKKHLKKKVWGFLLFFFSASLFWILRERRRKTLPLVAVFSLRQRFRPFRGVPFLTVSFLSGNFHRRDPGVRRQAVPGAQVRSEHVQRLFQTNVHQESEQTPDRFYEGRVVSRLGGAARFHVQWWSERATV